MKVSIDNKTKEDDRGRIQILPKESRDMVYQAISEVCALIGQVEEMIEVIKATPVKSQSEPPSVVEIKVVMMMSRDWNTGVAKDRIEHTFHVFCKGEDTIRKKIIAELRKVVQRQLNELETQRMAVSGIFSVLRAIPTEKLLAGSSKIP